MSLVLVLLAGCNYEFGFVATEEKDGEEEIAEDTAGLDTATDTAEPEDTADSAPQPGDDTAEETDPPDTNTAPDSGEDTSSLETGDTADSAPEEEDPPPADDCVTTSDLVYVLSRSDNRLYTFDPASLSFTSLGTIDCRTSQTPGSMAVSRDGVAYVRYADDAVYAVDLATLTCSSTAYSDRRTGFDSFGMGYATDSADTWRDRLFVANASDLGVLDTSTWSITTVGRMPSQSELTGNADGELWAMLPLERPAELRQLDTTTGATLTTLRLSSFPDPSDIDAFAFATWNGDFYLFVRMYGMGSTTDVYRVTSTGTMTTVLTDIGFDVVGAGVSTCAPS